jgi:hypothetical protein
MQRFANFVNLFFDTVSNNGPKFLFLLTNFSGRRTIAKLLARWQGIF